MTTQELADGAVPYARRALKSARPQIKAAVGRAGWVLLWPAWAVVTGPLLGLLIRIGIELAIGLLSPRLLLILDLIARLIAAFPAGDVPEPDRVFLMDLAALLRTPRSEMLPPVRETLVWRENGGGGPDPEGRE